MCKQQLGHVLCCTVAGTGKFHFAHPSTQQHLLVWRDRPKVVLVIKKLGKALTDEFFQVVKYLGDVERMHVIVESHMFERCIQHGLAADYLYTFTEQETERYAVSLLNNQHRLVGVALS